MKPDNPIKRFFARFRRKPKSGSQPQPEPAVPEEEVIDIFELTWKGKALADFKAWLDDLPEDRPCADNDRIDKNNALPVLSCDLYTLLSEFVALRQEIKLQNREQHAAIHNHENLVESIKNSITLFQKASRDLDTLEERIRMTAEIHSVEHFFDVRDALSRGLDAGKTALSGIFFFRRSSREHLTGVVEGYEMALRRFDRILGRFHITPLSAIGKPFDPAFMRAVGKKIDPTKAAGIVIEEQLGGYMQGDVVLRFAEVIVNG